MKLFLYDKKFDLLINMYNYGYTTGVKSSKELKITQQSAYKWLNQLERKGIVKHEINKANGCPPIKVYRLTPKGSELTQLIIQHIKLIYSY